ncbi:sulfite exporter TauE/SafE family protein [Ramlibacter sp. USB13]|uniref:Sulfite exporter TauE/SafE family protein n=1 Tax=Ramlibacter cellulosilyticus TaxID=2764187 RepID=A0A923SAU4_9BURK|nr:sulfite exporter TauE/SafE family protein [Ramlibacter cellulosilyticus]MBC5783146.1 sulfite exporter TauE/SafE family protein [Ramlibacter cellulosilyticus]
MTLTLAGTAFLMGLVGGPHCLAMCGAACGGVVRAAGAQPVRGMWTFQGGRLVGYSLAGAAAGLAVQSFAWLSSNTAALKPVWTLFHVMVLLWGLMLLAKARQPAWVESAGRGVWSRVRPMAQRRGGLLATGALWAFMPCGLLYSALLVASLSGGALEGALSMALFAIGSGISLGLAPSALRKLQELGNRLRKDWGTRIAGGLLALTAAWALWMDLAHRIAQWCGIG